MPWPWEAGQEEIVRETVRTLLRGLPGERPLTALEQRIAWTVKVAVLAEAESDELAAETFERLAESFSGQAIKARNRSTKKDF